MQGSEIFLLQSSGNEYFKLMLYGGALLLLILLGFLVVTRVKRYLQEQDLDSPAAAGFTLSDLRQLHRNGQMSAEELERAKAKVVEAARRAAEREQRAVLGRRSPEKRSDTDH